MLKYLRQNPMIAAGILMPLVIVVFFILATAIPRSLVAPPAHDFLFTTAGESGCKPEINVRFDVVDERLRARVFKTNVTCRRVPRLYLFDHETLDVREVEFDWPHDLESFEDGDEINIAAFANRSMSSKRKAPDEYEVRFPGYRSDNLMTALFGGQRRYGFSIHKSGNAIELPRPEGSVNYYTGMKFVGWLTD